METRKADRIVFMSPRLPYEATDLLPTAQLVTAVESPANLVLVDPSRNTRHRWPRCVQESSGFETLRSVFPAFV